MEETLIPSSKFQPLTIALNSIDESARNANGSGVIAQLPQPSHFAQSVDVLDLQANDVPWVQAITINLVQINVKQIVDRQGIFEGQE
jgi:hypothetical protein